MLRQSVLKRHAGLVDKMADRVGVDIEEEILRGSLETGEVSDMVLRCTSCTNPDDCAALLDSQEKQGSMPEYCRNARVFQKLGAES